jgi:uncharacterized protein
MTDMPMAQQIKPESDRGAVTYPLPDGIVVERKIPVVMRDGVKLSATVFRPSRPGRYPVIMCVTAYGKDLGPAQYSTLPKLLETGMSVGTFRIADATTWEGPDPGFWVPHDYAVVVADARGYCDSEGVAGIVSRQDAEDYAELITWAGTREWSTGAVGLNGVSYLAISQWNCVSRTRPAHLKAIIPWEGVTDFGRDVLMHGGIPENRFRTAWISGSLTRAAGSEIQVRANALLEEAIRDPFPLEDIAVPTLVCASWSDHGLHTRGSFEGFMRISSPQKWLYTHGRNKWDVYYGADAVAWQKEFFDHFLKGANNGFAAKPRIRLEIRKTKWDYEVRSENEWPLARTKFTKLFLNCRDRSLVADRPIDEVSVQYDSEAGETLTFDVTFAQTMELTGPVVLRLWVTADDADDLDLFAALRKLDRESHDVWFCGKDGHRQGSVAAGWSRVSERKKDPARSAPWRPYLKHTRPEKVRPGESVPVEIEILPSSTLFEAGEALRLLISGREIVGHDRFGHDETVNKGMHTIRAGGRYDSYLLVPVIPPA